VLENEEIEQEDVTELTNILVTGATGFIGSHLAKRLLGHGHTVVTIAHDTYPPMSRPIDFLGINDKIVYAHGSITDLELLKRVVSDYEIEQIYHMAVFGLVKRANISPIPVWRTNIEGTWNVMEAARDCDAAVLYMSTDKVYGDYGNTPYREDFALRGVNVYDCSKACGEMIARSYHFVYGVKTLIIRMCNAYGPADLDSRLVPNTLRSCLAGKNPVVYDGITYLREWIFVNDTVEALTLAMNNIKRTDGESYNIGTGYRATQADVVAEILKYFPHLKPEITPPLPYMKKEIPNNLVSSEKFRKTFVWSPKTDFATGIKLTAKWWIDNSEKLHQQKHASFNQNSPV
jgi:CDP-glucose 4,6-dehydratase